MVRPRRSVAAALTIAAVAVTGLSILSAADAGYGVDNGRLMLPQHRQGHVYLNLLGDPLEVGIAVALAMLVAAGYFGIERPRVRVGGAIAAGVAGALLAVVCFGELQLRSMFGESGGSTVATSARFEVLQYRRSGGFESDDVVLRLRSRQGLMSYESGTDIACFIVASSGSGPEWLFDRASLRGDDTVQVAAKDGTTWDIRFDPHTLRPQNPVDRCTHAPDPVGWD